MKYLWLAIAVVVCGCKPTEADDPAAAYRMQPKAWVPPISVTSRRFDVTNARPDAVDPEDWVSDAQTLQRQLTPNVAIEHALAFGDGYKLSPDGSTVTFSYHIDLVNLSLRQIAEVDVALAVTKASTNEDIYRSEPVKFTKFTNFRVPHVGALEGYTTLGAYETTQLTIPSNMWRTDVYLHPVVTRMVPVVNERNLHDIGNLIAFMYTHKTQVIERAFLDDPTLVQACDTSGTNARTVAMACGTPLLVKFVMKHTICPHGDGPDDSAFEYAVAGNNPKTLDYLLKLGYDVNFSSPNSKTTPLLVAVQTGSNRSVDWLIKHGGNVNALDANRESLLGYAIRYGNMPAFKMLLAAMAPIHNYDSMGYGLMHLAIEYPQFLPLVLAAGVPVDDSWPNSKQTPLMVAATSCNYKACHWLLDHGANLYAKNDNGFDVLGLVRLSNTLHTENFFRNGMGDLEKYEHKH